MKIYGVTGRKNCGKTGLVERLVAAFTARGLRVATIKHAHHEADVDHPGTDSHRHRRAGAGQVLLATPDRWALMTELRGAPEPSLRDLIGQLAPHDLVLVEGFKSGSHPMIECYRAAAGQALLAPEHPNIRAIASDCPIEARRDGVALPLFGLDDTGAVADFIWSDLT